MTTPKRLRVFFKYDRKLNTLLFRAAWGSLSQALGIKWPAPLVPAGLLRAVVKDSPMAWLARERYLLVL